MSPSSEGGAIESIRPDLRKLSRKSSCSEHPLNGGRFVHGSVSCSSGIPEAGGAEPSIRSVKVFHKRADTGRRPQHVGVGLCLGRARDDRDDPPGRNARGLAYRRYELVRVNGTEIDVQLLNGKKNKNKLGAPSNQNAVMGI
jgi:hypothetical protein